MRVRTAFLLILLWSGAGHAQERATTAAEQLLAATVLLDEAETARDRIDGLTQAIRAYELGLAALRGELTGLAIKQRRLRNALTSEETDLAALLALMQAAAQQTKAQSLLYPGSAPESLRSGMLAAALVPALEARADELEGMLIDLRATTETLQAGQTRLKAGRGEIEAARARIVGALELRTDLPDRLATDRAAMQALVANAASLSALADSLGSDHEEFDAPSAWAFPVPPLVVLDIATAGPGWRISLPDSTMVTAPMDATIRFSGEISGQGEVIILEAQDGHLAILGGLGQSLIAMEDIVEKGAPLGFLPRGSDLAQDKLNASDGESSLPRNETLYIEIRTNGAPVDPATIFPLDQQ